MRLRGLDSSIKISMLCVLVNTASGHKAVARAWVR